MKKKSNNGHLIQILSYIAIYLEVTQTQQKREKERIFIFLNQVFQVRLK